MCNYLNKVQGLKDMVYMLENYVHVSLVNDLYFFPGSLVKKLGYLASNLVSFRRM